jgi:hypothetical protein
MLIQAIRQYALAFGQVKHTRREVALPVTTIDVRPTAIPGVSSPVGSSRPFAAITMWRARSRETTNIGAAAGQLEESLP